MAPLTTDRLGQRFARWSNARRRPLRPPRRRHPMRSGRLAPAPDLRPAPPADVPAPAPADDLRLFATTFAAGFLFVSVLIF